jgi:hypothetical protein
MVKELRLNSHSKGMRLGSLYNTSELTIVWPELHLSEEHPRTPHGSQLPASFFTLQLVMEARNPPPLLNCLQTSELNGLRKQITG